MALLRNIILSCLLVTSVASSDEGYDPGYHGPKNADADLADDTTGFGAPGPDRNAEGYGANNGNAGNNQWTPVAGPSGGDIVYVDKKGSKTLVAGSPTSPIAEAINFNPPPPSPLPSPPLSQPYQQQYVATFHKSYQPQPPALLQQPAVPVESNIVHTHDHQIPTKTIINTIHVPVAQPYKVYVNKKVPFEVKVPVKIPVPRPVQVPVSRPVSVPVDKPYEVVVERKVPYEVRVPVEVPVQVPYPVDVPQPYPVPVPVPKPILIKHPVPVVIKIIKENERRKGWFW